MFGRQQPANDLRLQAGTTPQLGLREPELAPARVDSGQQVVDLSDPGAGGVVGSGVLRLLEPPT